MTATDWRLCVRGHRDARGLAATEVAHRVGISRTHLWNIETGRQHPTVPVAERLATVLGLSLSKLLDLRDGLQAHVRDEPHRYRIECEVCGQRGVVQLSIEPQRSESA